MKPLVSICIPTYNGAKYLKECLDSVLAQTFGDFEILLVDDNSSDNTVSIAREYAQRDKRVRVEQNEHNLGLVHNWNRCVKLARGEWLKFVFQDDLITNNCVEKLIAHADTATSIICCKRNFIFEEGIDPNMRKSFLASRNIDQLFPGKTKISNIEFCNVLLNNLEKYYVNFIGEPTALMIRKDTFYRFGLFNTHFISLCDYEYWLRIAINKGLTYVPETLATFRVHKLATTSRDKEKRSFMMGTLDPLLILHEFCFNPLYEPMREVAGSRKPQIDLINLLAYETRGALKLASQRSVKQNEPTTQRMGELKNLFRSYPALKVFSKRIFVHSKKLKMLLDTFNPITYTKNE